MELKGNKAIVMRQDGSFAECANPSHAKIGEKIDIIERRPFSRLSVWIPVAAAAALLLAFIGLNNSIGINTLYTIDNNDTPLGIPETSESLDRSILVQLPGDHLLTAWLTEERTSLSWRSDIPLKWIILRCAEKEYLYDVSAYLGVDGLTPPQGEIIQEIGVFTDPVAPESTKNQAGYLVLKDGDTLPPTDPNPQAEYYEQMLWLLKKT
jgi:hypothetical protein